MALAYLSTCFRYAVDSRQNLFECVVDVIVVIPIAKMMNAMYYQALYMQQQQQQPMCSPLSTSSQGSSSGSDDELGLKNMVNGFYAPYLSEELERLFAAPPEVSKPNVYTTWLAANTAASSLGIVAHVV